jgi:mono/diheme cytochrome c family protein
MAVLLLPLVTLPWFASLAAATPPTAEERAQVSAADAALKKAGNLYRSKKFAEAAALLEKIQGSLDALAENQSSELAALTGDLHKRLARARELLKKEGIELRPATRAPRPASATERVSFTRQIAPLLVARCAGCHIQRARGELSMASYASLAKGSLGGTVIMAGDAKGSRIVEVIESGDMPRSGGKVTPAELALLTAWIDQGAKFDGKDPAVQLTSLVPAGTGQAARLEVVPANRSDEVQFARDLGKTFIEQCLECHGQQNPRSGFSLNTFNRLLAGGDNGPALAPGKPGESLLARKLRGTSGKRMPLERPPLSEETIAKIEKWIALGARFDGADPATPLEDTVALVVALGSTHEQLRDSRAQLAAKNWRLILPDATGRNEATPQVLVYGAVGQELLADVARVADQQAAKIAALLKLPTDRPLVKGRLTLYVFDKRYDYGEVGTMLEHREIPAEWRGHWRYTGVDAYGCLLVEGDEIPPGLVAQQIAGAYVASLGKIPRWFAEGTARALAARLDPKDPRAKQWDDQAARLVKSADKPEAFLEGELPLEDADVLAYSFVKSLMSPPARYIALVAALEQGTKFDEAFSKHFRATPADVVAAWKTRLARGRGR